MLGEIILAVLAEAEELASLLAIIRLIKAAAHRLQGAIGKKEDGVKSNNLKLAIIQLFIITNQRAGEHKDVNGTIQDGVILRADFLLEEVLVQGALEEQRGQIAINMMEIKLFVQIRQQ